jgi:hypothetical protein
VLFTYLLDRDVDRVPVSSALVESAGHRRRLVRAAYRRYLDRAPDPGGRDHWTAYLGTGTVNELHALLLASPELYASAGGTDEGYVAEVYRRVLRREPDAAGMAYWIDRLDAGLSRDALAHGFVLSPEHLGKVVRRTFRRLLDRRATADELTRWVGPVAARDERDLVTAILAGDEYLTAVQP